MSLGLQVRRLASNGGFRSTLQIRQRVLRQQARFAFFGRDKGDQKENVSNPVLEEYNSQLERERAEGKSSAADSLKPGGLSSSSIFEDDRHIQKHLAGDEATESKSGTVNIGGVEREVPPMLAMLDPDPNARERWERKKVIEMVRKRGRLSKEEMIKRTEREHVSKSHNFKTSIKKLTKLAHQIAGKTLDEAITQMRFSKKGVAEDVLKQLEFARDEAIVRRGLGLGDDQEPTQIQLKNGRKHIIKNSSQIYIDQAWVGRGPYGKLPDYRARGRLFIMRTPWTHLTVVLKEEATRIREHAEREGRRRMKLFRKASTQLPDRPVVWQRPWYTF
ncbi:ribosomal protein L22 [Piedraia hortae CBS 480.64]|uniref:Ribosomal protein L22 n=1 Tax=Piedraia hortae CBS 480.64 TaxID=1314780 RepID=A0A6A7C1J0_9PEZI|nr:ribosomal protein L22 [Piedraia hortae CBS 480.64]